jgi:hypothetical protein
MKLKDIINIVVATLFFLSLLFWTAITAISFIYWFLHPEMTKMQIFIYFLPYNAVAIPLVLIFFILFKSSED